jgi:sugar/nucleoside kinase (ribokinase family)
MDVEEAIALTEAESKHNALRRLRGLVKESLVVVTEGVKPPILLTGGSVSEVGSERSRVCDKTGAGDYFLGKLFLRIVEGLKPREAVESALEETDRWLSRGEDKLLHRGVSPFSNF